MVGSTAYDADAVRAAIGPSGFWDDVRVVGETGSTNADLTALARAGAAEGTVVLADHQTAGRGRLGREWRAPAGTAVTVSMLFRPATVPAGRWPWLPLIVGLAVAEAVRAATGVPAALKWPNDVLVDGRKLAGLLAEVVPDGDSVGADRPATQRPDSQRSAGDPAGADGSGAAVVVGVGLNVTVAGPDLPSAATSLALCGATEVDRVRLLVAVLSGVAGRYESWRDAAGDPVAARGAYLPLCTTLGTQVRVQLPTGSELAGLATDIDSDGRLVVSTADGDRTLSVGDVVHVR